MSDSPALWLWLDVESSGLLDSQPVVLEAAWMFTDADLRQLSPLRQRLCAIPCQTSALRQWARRLTFRPAVPTVGRLWPVELLAEGVQEMHEQSGLWWDWTMHNHIGDVQELDMEIHEDHLPALQLLDPDGTEGVPLHLAGAGVAQFEARLLPMVGSIWPTQLHYRAADASVAGMTLGLPKITEPDPDDGLELDIQEGCDVQRATTAPHRAATDVRAAYRQVRDMRAARRPPGVVVDYQL